ncbi:MAG: ADP-ribosyltransferase, partial [Micromonosporaceae bacterium]
MQPEDSGGYELTVEPDENGDPLLHLNGEPFDTSGGRARANGLPAAMAVLTADGRILVSNRYRPEVFHHSSLVAGEPVAAAVMLSVRDGRVVAISDRGVAAYDVPLRHTYQFLAELEDAGIVVEPEQTDFQKAFSDLEWQLFLDAWTDGHHETGAQPSFLTSIRPQWDAGGSPHGSYGPFHIPATTEQIADLADREHLGPLQLPTIPSNVFGSTLTARAFEGHLPAGVAGIEFYTDKRPDLAGSTMRGVAKWSLPQDAVALEGSVDQFPVTVTQSATRAQVAADNEAQARRADDGGPATEPRYRDDELTSMREAHQGEQHRPRGTRYFTEAERERYRLRIGPDGKLYDSAGNLFDTRLSVGRYLGIQHAIFVMDAAGNIYAATEEMLGDRSIKHSSFLAGEQVMAAGEIQVINGVVKVITNNTGHYQTKHGKTREFVERLRSAGVPVEGVKLLRHAQVLQMEGAKASFVTSEPYRDVDGFAAMPDPAQVRRSANSDEATGRTRSASSDDLDHEPSSGLRRLLDTPSLPDFEPGSLETVLNGGGRSEGAVNEQSDMADAAQSQHGQPLMLTPLKNEYDDEQSYDHNPARYVKPEDRGSYELTIERDQNGEPLLYLNGQPFDTSDGQARVNGFPAAMAVMDKDGRIYASNEFEPQVFHHSSLLGGADVAAAVTLEVENGRVVGVSDSSVAAYRTFARYTYQFLGKLEDAGIVLEPHQINITTSRTDAEATAFLRTRPEGAPLPSFLETVRPQWIDQNGPAKYGPFHVPLNAKMTPEVAQQMVGAQQLSGMGSDVLGRAPMARAIEGRLPPGTPGFEFYTDVPPNPAGETRRGAAEWTLNWAPSSPFDSASSSEAAGRLWSGASEPSSVAVIVTVSSLDLESHTQALAEESLADDAGRLTEPKHETFPMRDKFQGVRNEYRFNDTEREEARIRVGPDGRLRDSKGKLFDTRRARTWAGYDVGAANFVMDAAGNIYSFTSPSINNMEVNHATFLDGRSIAAGGTWIVHDGVIKRMGNDSGHYWPKHVQTQRAVEELRDRNVDVTGVRLLEDQGDNVIVYSTVTDVPHQDVLESTGLPRAPQAPASPTPTTTQPQTAQPPTAVQWALQRPSRPGTPPSTTQPAAGTSQQPEGEHPPADPRQAPLDDVQRRQQAAEGHAGSGDNRSHGSRLKASFNGIVPRSIRNALRLEAAPQAGAEPQSADPFETQRDERLQRESVTGRNALNLIPNGRGWQLGDRPAAITDETVAAFQHYTSVEPRHYIRINNALRELARGLTPEQRAEFARRDISADELAATDAYAHIADVQERHQQARQDSNAVNLVTRAYPHMEPTAEPVDLRRQVRNLTEILGRDHDLKGMEFSDDAFSSTTVGRGNFSLEDGDAQITIYVDGGAKLIYTGEMSSILSEQEILLPRGSRFKIISHDKG